MTKVINTNKTHVVHFIPTLNFGGAEKFVLSLVKSMSKKYIRQSIVIFWDEKPLAVQLPKHISCTLIPFKDIPYYKRRSVIAKHLQDVHADVIHTHLFSADLWGRLAAKTCGLPIITTEHNVNISEPKIFRVVKRLMKRYSDVYTAPSEAVSRYMQKKYKIKAASIKMIRHGIDLEAFDVKRGAGMYSPYSLAIVGRVTEQKGHYLLLEALTYIRNLEYELIITGDGDQKETLQNYAKELKVDDRIEWVDFTHDVAGVYADADIVIVPSLWEGLGLVALEAMATGRLVIAANVDGLREIIEHNKTGILFQRKEPRDLAQKIRQALQHRKESLMIAKNGKRWVQEHADVTQMVKAYEELYLSLKK